MPVALGLMVIYSIKIGLIMLMSTAVSFIVLEAISSPPANSPRNFLKKFLPNTMKNAPIMVCLGDSLTHGNCSASFTPDIPRKVAKRMGMAPPGLGTVFSEPLWVVNAGKHMENEFRNGALFFRRPNCCLTILINCCNF